MARGRANGRVVLVGEHSVVYGKKALVSSVDLGVRVGVDDGRLNGLVKSNEYLKLFVETFEEETGLSLDKVGLAIEADLPQKRGLSSSSALACAMFRALGEWFGIEMDNERVLELVLKAERKIYPVSGMDQTAVVYGGVFEFERRGEELVRRGVEARVFEGVRLMLVDSGMPEESTAEMVGQVSNRLKDNSKKYIMLIDHMGRVAEKFIEGLREGRFEWRLMSENERLLEELGVVGERARGMVREIENMGGAAKISGAGGAVGGSGYLVCYHPDEEALVDLAERRGWEHRLIKVGET